MEGVDYSWSRPNPAGLYAAGKRFAVRYLSYNKTGKNLTIAERDRLWAAGLSIVLNWEDTQGAALDGWGRGVQHGRDAAAMAHSLGTDTKPIYFSCDVDPRGFTPGQWSAVRDYYAGVVSQIGHDRAGEYGGLALIDHAISQNWTAYHWQTYAWSGGVWRSGIHMRQWHNGVLLAGGDVDLDTALVEQFGQWAGVSDMGALTTDDAGWLDTLFRVDSMLHMADPVMRTGEANELAKAIRGMVADLAAIKASESASLAAIQAVLTMAQQGGGSIEQAPILAAIEAARDDAHNEAATLLQQIAEQAAEIQRLRAALAAGAAAEAQQLG